MPYINSNINPDELKLILATESLLTERINISLRAELTLIAESKVQEIKEKYDVVKEIRISSIL